MATDKPLEQIKKMFEAEREHTRQLVREEIGTAEKRMSAKIATAKQEIIAKIEKEAETTAGFFHETWNKLEKLDDHETRISQLEEDAEFPRTH